MGDSEARILALAANTPFLAWVILPKISGRGHPLHQGKLGDSVMEVILPEEEENIKPKLICRAWWRRSEPILSKHTFLWLAHNRNDIPD